MKLKLVNIEAGRPTIEIGQKKLYLEITTAKRQGIHVLKVIHGYGSSGVGGGLKKGILDYLAGKKKEGFIKDFVAGEDWDIFSPSARRLIDQHSDLRKDADLGRGNPGITMVLI